MKTNSTLKLTRIVPLLSLIALPFAVTGCGSYPESNVVSAPPPQVVQPQPQQVVVTQQPSTQVVTATPVGNGQFIINQAPPVQQQVIVTQPSRPSSSHVWVEGYWSFKNQRYEWVASHWEVPPFSGAKWVPPRSERLSDGNYRFYEGYWN